MPSIGFLLVLAVAGQLRQGMTAGAEANTSDATTPSSMFSRVESTNSDVQSKPETYCEETAGSTVASIHSASDNAEAKSACGSGNKCYIGLESSGCSAESSDSSDSTASDSCVIEWKWADGGEVDFLNWCEGSPKFGADRSNYYYSDSSDSGGVRSSHSSSLGSAAAAAGALTAAHFLAERGNDDALRTATCALPLGMLAFATGESETEEASSETEEASSESSGRCGPLYDGRVCDCAGGDARFCNEDNGWCGMTTAHETAQASTSYDCASGRNASGKIVLLYHSRVNFSRV